MYDYFLSEQQLLVSYGRFVGAHISHIKTNTAITLWVPSRSAATLYPVFCITLVLQSPFWQLLFNTMALVADRNRVIGGMLVSLRPQG